MEARLVECDALDARNESLQRRIEEVRAEIRESRQKIEEVKNANRLMEMDMDASDRELRALLKQKDASFVCVELNKKTLELAKEKLARLVIGNAKTADDNANWTSEWRDHIEHSEKVLAHLRTIYENAPWIADAETSRSNIEVATKETDKLWEALRASFEASSGEATDEDAFMQQMTVIRRLGNKILRNNREWAKIFKATPKPKRQLLDADALLNDSLADLDEEEADLDRENNHQPALDNNNGRKSAFEINNNRSIHLEKYVENVEALGKRKKDEFVVPEVPKKVARVESEVARPSQQFVSEVPKKIARVEDEVRPSQHFVAEAPKEIERVEGEVHRSSQHVVSEGSKKMKHVESEVPRSSQHVVPEAPKKMARVEGEVAHSSQHVVSEGPKKTTRAEGEVSRPSQHVTFASPAHTQFYQPQESFTESIDRPERSEPSSSSGEQLIFDCTTEEKLIGKANAANESKESNDLHEPKESNEVNEPKASNDAHEPREALDVDEPEKSTDVEPSFLACINDKDSNATQDALEFNFNLDGNESQADGGIFNLFGNDDNVDGDGNNDFQFNFGTDDGNEDGGNGFPFGF
uniref:BRCT domain-containing protein n=1 Tax=Steinernema glaseri TaxID=37863 RepID=A0A1I8AG80_9BILA